ncbi:MAG TPA: hypothetical protein VNU27_04535 [Candidatus Acidoferrum sp.]|nr:hypothetical protein [Candidatus Acidoferrum sp.]
MSAQLSPDGMFYWDGRQWMSTLSPDGRVRWNGTAWLPTGRAYVPPQYQSTGRASRVATSWTRPLQLAVAGWYVLEGVYALTLPFWMGGPMTQAMNQSIQRQQQLYPTVSPPPVEFTNLITSMVGGILWVSAFFGLAIAVVAVIGAMKRWTWTFYAVLVLLGLSVVSLPITVVDALGGSTISAASGFNLPSWTYWLGLASAIPSTALFVWMLVALVKRGPWAMRKVTPQPG